MPWSLISGNSRGTTGLTGQVNSAGVDDPSWQVTVNSVGYKVRVSLSKGFVFIG